MLLIVSHKNIHINNQVSCYFSFGGVTSPVILHCRTGHLQFMAQVIPYHTDLNFQNNDAIEKTLQNVISVILTLLFSKTLKPSIK